MTDSRLASTRFQIRGPGRVGTLPPSPGRACHCRSGYHELTGLRPGGKSAKGRMKERISTVLMRLARAMLAAGVPLRGGIADEQPEGF